jgi:hypothetical protein
MIITLSDTKKYLGFEGASDYDEILKSLINLVSSWTEMLIGRKIEATNVTEYFDGGTLEIILNHFPVNSVASVKYNAGTQNTPNWQTISAEDYTKYLGEGIIKHVSIFPDGDRNIEVVYNAGFSTVPDDLKLLALELVGRLFNQRKAQGIKSESMGSAKLDWSSDLTEDQKMIIGNYRKIRV